MRSRSPLGGSHALSWYGRQGGKSVLIVALLGASAVAACPKQVSEEVLTDALDQAMGGYISMDLAGFIDARTEAEDALRCFHIDGVGCSSNG